MNYLRTILIAGVIGLFSSGAVAFEQTQLGDGNAAKNTTEGVPSGIPGVKLTNPTTSTIAKPSTGTQLRLPGFGVIGTLPKFDFGLELLYSDEREETLKEDPGLTSEGLTIHGSVKHRF